MMLTEKKEIGFVVLTGVFVGKMDKYEFFFFIQGTGNIKLFF